MRNGTLTSQGRKPNILLIEDSEGDVLLMREAFSNAKIACEIVAVTDGHAALELLLHLPDDKSQVTLPDLILLDFNLPGMHSLSILAVLKEDMALRHIPVIILSGSISDMDILKAYDEYANCCIMKPGSLKEFEELIAILGDFWFNTIILPHRH